MTLTRTTLLENQQLRIDPMFRWDIQAGQGEKGDQDNLLPGSCTKTPEEWYRLLFCQTSFTNRKYHSLDLRV